MIALTLFCYPKTLFQILKLITLTILIKAMVIMEIALIIELTVQIVMTPLVKL